MAKRRNRKRYSNGSRQDYTKGGRVGYQDGGRGREEFDEVRKTFPIGDDGEPIIPGEGDVPPLFFIIGRTP